MLIYVCACSVHLPICILNQLFLLLIKQISSLNPGEASALGGVGIAGRAFVGGMPGLPTTDHAVMGRHGAIVPDLARNGRSTSFEDHLPINPRARPGREIAPLPPDASSTLYVEGLPPDCSRREVARILLDMVMLLNFIYHYFESYLNLNLV